MTDATRVKIVSEEGCDFILVGDYPQQSPDDLFRHSHYVIDASGEILKNRDGCDEGQILLLRDALKRLSGYDTGERQR